VSPLALSPLTPQDKLLGTTSAAPCGGFTEIQQLVRSLPDADAPALFGLAANVERASQESSSARVVRDLRALSHATLAGAGFDRARWAAQLAPLLRCWESAAARDGVLAESRRVTRTASGARAPQVRCGHLLPCLRCAERD